MSIIIENVSKKFGAFTALDRVSLDVPDGELLALLGPSGSGKTTLLRIIAGLEVADSGTVISDGEDITQQSARHRKVGFVFQHYALFRHMTVAENIAYGLRVRKAPRGVIRERVEEMLSLIRLETLQNRYPAQLSGGQRQRVALARALAAKPSVLLLDEPFGALDAKVRQELRLWLRRLHNEIHVTSIFVTHDQEEAFEVADRVVVMNHARIEQIGTPHEVYSDPATAFVYQFLGNVTTFRGTVRDGWFQLGQTSVYLPIAEPVRNGPAIACVRNHDVRVHLAPVEATIPAKITHVNAAGSVVRVELERADDKSRIVAEVSRESAVPALHPGATVFVELEHPRIFADDEFAHPSTTTASGADTRRDVETNLAN
jgi:sulfate transport system ATP-binding protein